MSLHGRSKAALIQIATDNEIPFPADISKERLLQLLQNTPKKVVIKKEEERVEPEVKEEEVEDVSEYEKQEQPQVPSVMPAPQKRLSPEVPICPKCEQPMKATVTRGAFTRYECKGTHVRKNKEIPCFTKVNMPRPRIAEQLERQKRTGLQRIIARESQRTQADKEQHP